MLLPGARLKPDPGQSHVNKRAQRESASRSNDNIAGCQTLSAVQHPVPDFRRRPGSRSQSVISLGGLQGAEYDPNSIVVGHSRSVRVL
jgi:hypothetical protein